MNLFFLAVAVTGTTLEKFWLADINQSTWEKQNLHLYWDCLAASLISVKNILWSRGPRYYFFFILELREGGKVKQIVLIAKSLIRFKIFIKLS